MTVIKIVGVALVGAEVLVEIVSSAANLVILLESVLVMVAEEIGIVAGMTGMEAGMTDLEEEVVTVMALIVVETVIVDAVEMEVAVDQEAIVIIAIVLVLMNARVVAAIAVDEAVNSGGATFIKSCTVACSLLGLVTVGQECAFFSTYDLQSCCPFASVDLLQDDLLCLSLPFIC